MPATHDNITTIEELLALPEDRMRHELLEGVHVVTPSPRYDHQNVFSELFAALLMALKGHATLKVLSSPADIRLGPATLVQPDIFVLEIPAGGIAQDWSDAPVPLVVIEILSPSTALRDRGAKRRIYQHAGVAEYWIVDIDARLIERWTPGDVRPEICDSELACTIGDTNLTIMVDAIFN